MALSAQLVSLPELTDERSRLRFRLSFVTSARADDMDMDGVRALVHDLSTTGCRIETDASLEVGDTIIVELPEDPERAALIRWKEQSMIGCEFVEPLGQEQMVRILLSAPVTQTNPMDDSLVHQVSLGVQPDYDTLAGIYRALVDECRRKGDNLLGVRVTEDGEVFAMIAKLH